MRGTAAFVLLLLSLVATPEAPAEESGAWSVTWTVDISWDHNGMSSDTNTSRTFSPADLGEERAARVSALLDREDELCGTWRMSIRVDEDTAHQEAIVLLFGDRVCEARFLPGSEVRPATQAVAALYEAVTGTPLPAATQGALADRADPICGEPTAGSPGRVALSIRADAALENDRISVTRHEWDGDGHLTATTTCAGPPSGLVETSRVEQDWSGDQLTGYRWLRDGEIVVSSTTEWSDGQPIRTTSIDHRVDPTVVVDAPPVQYYPDPAAVTDMVWSGQRLDGVERLSLPDMGWVPVGMLTADFEGTLVVRHPPYRAGHEYREVQAVDHYIYDEKGRLKLKISNPERGPEMFPRSEELVEHREAPIWSDGGHLLSYVATDKEGKETRRADLTWDGDRLVRAQESGVIWWQHSRRDYRYSADGRLLVIKQYRPVKVEEPKRWQLFAWQRFTYE